MTLRHVDHFWVGNGLTCFSFALGSIAVTLGLNLWLALAACIVGSLTYAYTAFGSIVTVRAGLPVSTLARAASVFVEICRMHCCPGLPRLPSRSSIRFLASTRCSRCSRCSAGMTPESRASWLPCCCSSTRCPAAFLLSPSDALVRPGRRLIEDASVAGVVSLSSLKLMRDRTKKDRAPASKLIAVFADPVFGRNDPRVRPGGAPAGTAAPNAELARVRQRRRPSPTGSPGCDAERELPPSLRLAPASLRWEALDFDAQPLGRPRSATGRLPHRPLRHAA